MKRRPVILVALLCLLAARLPAEWGVYFDTEAAPGDVVRIYIHAPADASGIEAALAAGGTAICRNIAARLSEPVGRTTEHGDVYASLLAIPSTFEGDHLTVRVSGADSSGRFEHISLLLVQPRRFKTEEIGLSGAMSDLRRSDAAEIAEQSRRLWEILTTRRRHTVVDNRCVRYPLDSIEYTSFFGDRRTYRYADGGTDFSIHNGVDYRGATGTPVHAAASGRVVFASPRIITGNTVIIEHFAGVYTLYYHLDTVGVTPEQTVRAGAEIGTVGATGLVTGPHLHWELRVAGVAVDPEQLVGSPILDRSAGFLHILR